MGVFERKLDVSLKIANAVACIVVPAVKENTEKATDKVYLGHP